MITEVVEREPGLEEMLLTAGEQISKEVYEQFLQGRLALPELENVYATLTDWRRLSEDILTVLHHAR